MNSNYLAGVKRCVLWEVLDTFAKTVLQGKSSPFYNSIYDK